MRIPILPFIILISTLGYSQSNSQYQSGKEVTITESQPGDMYVAAGRVSVESSINGDLMAAGGNIYIKDSVLSDLTATGGNIDFSGYVGDDMRCAGGHLEINGIIGDDLMIFGGELIIGRETIVNGDIVAYGGNITHSGLVKGNFKSGGTRLIINGSVDGMLDFEGEEIELNGTINKDAKIAANKITVAKTAIISGNLEYWSPSGELDFDPNLVSGSITYNPELQPKDFSSYWSTGGGILLIFLLIYIPAAWLIIIFLNMLFGSNFQTASTFISTNFLKSMGAGTIYILTVPLLIILLFVLIVGIPISLFILFLYIFSLLFGHVVASLILVYYMKEQRKKDWSPTVITMYSLGIFLMIRIVTLIPFLGWLWSFAVIATSYGAIILSYRTTEKVK